MVISKKMKRLLCLAVVCLMLTPIISFATTDNPAPDANNNDTQTGADNPGDTAGNENEAETIIQAVKTPEMKLPEQKRHG